jgi:hypothetical protein
LTYIVGLPFAGRSEAIEVTHARLARHGIFAESEPVVVLRRWPSSEVGLTVSTRGAGSALVGGLGRGWRGLLLADA